MMRTLLVALPFLCASSQPDAAAWEGALSTDDECGSRSGANCALNALQLNRDGREATQSREAKEADLLARSVNTTALASEATARCRYVYPCSDLCRCAPGGPPGSGWTQWVCNVHGKTIFCADDCSNCQYLR
mmetsp:Transcript_138006/g.428918  ORF Transcript_138006/g.428918 Transcript_138006/m.428918 type:complete len:132 (+) Transcript_138006:71-466(+)